MKLSRLKQIIREEIGEHTIQGFTGSWNDNRGNKSPYEDGIDNTLKALKDLGVLDVEDKVLALIKKYVQDPTGENPFSGDIVNEGK